MAPRSPPSNPPDALGGELAEGVGVMVWCDRCGHHATVEAGPLGERLGPGTRIPAVRKLFVCSR
jgi:hypothetical protein